MALVGVIAIGGQSLTKPNVTVDRKFSGDGGLLIEGVGVCSVSAEKIACWTMDGAADGKLTERVKEHYGNNSQEIQLRFGKKNRFLLVEGPANQYLNLRNVDGNSSYTQTFNERDQQRRLNMLRIAAEPDATQGSVMVNLSGYRAPQPGVLEMRKGAKATFVGTTVEVHEWEVRKEGFVSQNRYPNGYPGYYGGSNEAQPQKPPKPQKAWNVFFNLQGLEYPTTYVQFEPLDRGGVPIKYVDRDGNPASPADFLRENPQSPMNMYPPQAGQPAKPKKDPNYFVSTFTYGQTIPGGAAVISTINPEKIGSLRMTTVNEYLIQINGFPLDPR